MKERNCGECIVCCVYLKINCPELKKAPLTHCPHLKLSEQIKENVVQYSTDIPCPCSIYDNKPEVCSGYHCLWRLGYGNDCDRPDRSGVLCDTSHNIENGIECKPLGPNFENKPKVIETIRRMCRSTGCIGMVTNFYERKFIRMVVRPI